MAQFNGRRNKTNFFFSINIGFYRPENALRIVTQELAVRKRIVSFSSSSMQASPGNSFRVSKESLSTKNGLVNISEHQFRINISALCTFILRRMCLTGGWHDSRAYNGLLLGCERKPPICSHSAAKNVCCCQDQMLVNAKWREMNFNHLLQFHYNAMRAAEI